MFRACGPLARGNVREEFGETTMRLGKSLMFVLLAISAVALLATAANAETIADANKLSGAAAVADAQNYTDYYVASNVTDGLCTGIHGGGVDPDCYSLLWDNVTQDQRVAILNFDAVDGIGTLRIWARPTHRTPAYLTGPT
jgi:hypothetical protein